MKENRKITLVSWIGALLFLLLVGLAGSWEHTYHREDCVVVAVQGDEVIAEDTLGYRWSWYIDEGSDVVEGDVVTLTMHTSFTHGDIDDDEVRGYKVQR